MNIDIQTLTFVLSISLVLQAVALYAQYQMKKDRRGITCWLVGSVMLALGFVLLLFQYVKSIEYFSVFFANTLILLGQIFLYLGVILFLRIKFNRWIVILVFVVFVAAFYDYTYVNLYPQLRIVFVSIAVALVALLTAEKLFIHADRRIAFSANFTAFVFLAFGCLSIVRALLMLFVFRASSLFEPLLVQEFAFLYPIITSALWTSGLILMVNQRLNSENIEAKEKMELIFYTSPDAVAITDLNGRIIDVNDGFFELFGLRRPEVAGKTVGELNLWNDPKDCSRIEEELSKSGVCKNMEIVFERRDGSQLTGAISARSFEIKGIVYVISVVRDVTERKLLEQRKQMMVEQLEIEKRYEQMSAMTDGLTGLPNRRSFDERLSAEFYRLRKQGLSLSLIMLDVDYFKKFNDTYGHLAGDDCLLQVAEVLKNSVKRTTDTVARFGGEEFAVILPETTQSTALMAAESIRREIESLHIPHIKSGISECVTVSLGVVCVSTELVIAPEKVVALADEALYLAKRNGRNRAEIVVYSPQSGDVHNLHSGFVELRWNVNNECGQAVIDHQHRRLFEIINYLLAAFIEKRTKEECGLLLDELLEDIINHFRTEEVIIRDAEYPFIEEHKNLHKKLEEKIVELIERFSRDELTLGELFSFLAYDVVAQHIIMEDKKYFPNIHNYVTAEV